MKNPLADKLLIESIRLEDGKMTLLVHHIERLHRVGKKFGLSTSHIHTQYLVDNILPHISPHDISPIKVRLEFGIQDNQLKLLSVQIESIIHTPMVRLTLFPIPKDSCSPDANCKINNALLYTDSINYAHQHDCDQAIILNERNEIVETSYCNIFFEKNNILYTPPLSSGCIEGIMRRIFMSENTVIEQTIYPDDIPSYDHILLTNAVRGVMEGRV